MPIKEPSLDEIARMDDASYRVYQCCRQDAIETKIDNYHGEVVQMVAVQTAHGEKIAAIEKRCAGCSVKVKALWAALGVALTAAVGALKFWKG